jgi:phage recombination protein Bet
MNEIVQAGGALAIRPDQTEWTPAQAAVLQQSGISDEVTAAELSGFLHLCQRTQLDPFSRQIYLIGRKDKRAGRTVFTPQTGIDGYRVVAHRVVAASREAFGYEDTQWCDQSGRWRDVWLSNEPPAAARVTVLRNGQRFPAIALFREYVQAWDGKPTGLWAKMPAGQLAKCAEALALRRAFPHDLAGVYTAEEMAQADNPTDDRGPAQVRQLRRVKPGEPDPWQADVPPASDADRAVVAAANLAERAADAKKLDEWRGLWAEAGTAGLMAVLIVDPDGDTQVELGAYLQRRGAALKGAPEHEKQLTNAELYSALNSGHPEVESQAGHELARRGLPPVPLNAVAAAAEHEHATALDALRAAALQAGIAATLDSDFRQSFGVAPTEATVEQLREMTALLQGAAA